MMTTESNEALPAETIRNHPAEKETLTAGGYLTLLRNNQNYRRLWLAQVISQLGDWFSLAAVIALITRYAGSAEAISGLLILRLGPVLVLSPFAGVLADRFNRRNLMIGADLSRVVFALGFLLVSSPDQLWLIYVLTVGQFSLSSVFDPSRNALIPAITSPEERVAANALGSLTWSVLLAVGAALGGLSTGLIGLEISFILDALSFVGSAALVAGIPAVMGRIAQQGGQRQSLRVFKDLLEGFSYLRQNPPIFGYTLIKPLAAISSGVFFSIMALQAYRVYPLGQNGSISLGLLYLAIGIGSGVGPLLFGAILRRSGETRQNLQRLVSLGFMLYGLGWGLYAFTGNLWLAVSLVILAELGGGSNWVFSTTLLQLGTEENFRGRVFSVEASLLTLLNIISALVGGFMLDKLKWPVELTGGSLSGLTMLVGFIWLVGTGFAARRLALRPAE
ncbi:MAG TPA: MFS transporter [Chloroflexia bacterium]|nr:MFS transporter [Chloroflexia bacterium]